jgi:hypothetical protein
MGRFNHIYIQIPVSHNGAADRGNPDGVSKSSGFLQDFHNQAVGDAVGATRAVMGFCVSHAFGHFKYSLHYLHLLWYLGLHRNCIRNRCSWEPGR